MDFYTRISNYYNDIFPLNKAQLPFVKSSVTNANKILDIGCGTGGLAIGLANIFDSVIAIDPNEKMLEIAKSENQKTNVEFIVGGMLEIDNLFKANCFNTVLCFGNTLVHLVSLEEINLFFKKVKNILKSDGSFFFQIINFDMVLDKNLPGLPTIENEEVKFVRNYSLDSEGRIDFSTILTIKETGDEINNNVKLFPIRKNEIEVALSLAGFNNIESYSSFMKHKYDKDKLPLVFNCS